MPETPIVLSQNTFSHIMDVVGSPTNVPGQSRSPEHLINTGFFRLDAATTAATVSTFTTVSASWCYFSGTGVAVGTSGWTIYSPMADVIDSGEYVIAVRWYGVWMITAAINFCPT